MSLRARFAICLTTWLWRFVDSSNCYKTANFTVDVWPHCQEIENGVEVYYSADQKYLKLGLHVSGGKGWSALAMAGNGGMKGAQMIVVRLDEGKWVAEERYSEDYVEPDMQETQDVELAFATEDSDGSSWGVLLPRSSCKKGQRYPIENSAQWMLHARNANQHNFGYASIHTSKTQFQANLVAGEKPHEDLSGYPEVTVQMPDVSVKDGDKNDPYKCVYLDRSQVFPEHMNLSTLKVARFSSYLSEVSKPYVHHMLLVGCDTKIIEDLNITHNQVATGCDGMPQGCTNMFFPWAVGSPPIQFPENVGFPLHEYEWFSLQIHYSIKDPAMDDVTDSSGVTMTLTERQVEAGVAIFSGGNNVIQRPLGLQPGIKNLKLDPSLKVSSTCMKHLVSHTPEKKVTVLTAGYHAHYLANRISMDVYKEGKWVNTLRTQRRWDFTHQGHLQSLLPELTGDNELMVTCWYDTSTKLERVFFGEGSSVEMCHTAMFYYPRNPQFELAAILPKRNSLTVWDNETYSVLCGNPYGQRFLLDNEFDTSVTQGPVCNEIGDLASADAASIVANLREKHCCAPAEAEPEEKKNNSVVWIVLGVVAGVLGLALMAYVYMQSGKSSNSSGDTELAEETMQ